MGCAQSRVDNEEAVARCKERRQFMKDAVAARNAFAAAHSAYVVAIKNTGAALSDFGQGEVSDESTSVASVARIGPSNLSGVTSAASAASVAPPMENLPPPPPPLPDFSPSPLQRSVSMPDLPKTYTSKFPTDDAIREEEGDEMDGSVHEDHGGVRGASPSGAAPAVSSPASSPLPPLLSRPQPSTSRLPPPMPESGGMGTWDYFFTMDENMSMPGPSLSQAEEIRPEPEEPIRRSPLEEPSVANDFGDEPPKTPEKLVVELAPLKGGKKKQGGMAHLQHASSAGVLETKKGKTAASGSTVSLLQVLVDLDEHFLRASESAHDVSKMLEATRMHYHSNFADNRGHIDHSARVMRVITWNRSFKGIPYANDGKNDYDNDEMETHATVLDKMLAWEKKLYDEVKTGELMKMEYQRKIALWNKQKRRGANPETLEKTKAAVSHSHIRYIVDLQSMDATVSEIQHLRDDQLYQKLVDLVDGMATMWGIMYSHHDSQLKTVIDLRVLDISSAPKETTEHHYTRTVQLHEVTKMWQSQFHKLVTHQKEYIHFLYNWLKLSLKPIENTLKEKVSSPPRIHHPPIQDLLQTWNDQLEKLPDDLAKSAISSFSAVINNIILLQQEELKLKEKCEEMQREYTRKARSFEDWYHKHSQRRVGVGADGEAEAEGMSTKDPVAERKFLVDSLKTKLDDDTEAYQKVCKQVREKTLASLKTHLPELFRAMSDFSMSCNVMYMNLKEKPQAHHPDTAGDN